ncbi:FkbM family methyltransferase [Massilia atriviolacea]|uniref:FkbM family methyltransferase n=1 Tax=Massilia atriviolacea TaxID=2495579 RepID=A0A430HDB3_9BURK|nr:FkbM family methyltransferase [Massilia atriviolacea]RSZ55526.1 FkbM family methyltransferase [Massilia atriviolacea]
MNAIAQTRRSGYSYQGQDAFVLEVLGGMRGGFFLDSGASDGFNGSNSLLLETGYGWNGICIEPNQAMFRALAARRRCLCLQCCLYDREGSVPFLESAGVFGGIVQEYDPGQLAYTEQMLAREGAPGAVLKPTHTLRAVLRQAGAPPVIDYWSLDTEGSELALLKSFPFDEYRFRVLTVEHNDTPARAAIHDYLVTRGYTMVRAMGIDDGYVCNSELGAPGWRSAAWRGPAWRGPGGGR